MGPIASLRLSLGR